jgi:hypothetical protein
MRLAWSGRKEWRIIKPKLVNFRQQVYFSWASFSWIAFGKMFLMDCFGYVGCTLAPGLGIPNGGEPALVCYIRGRGDGCARSDMVGFACNSGLITPALLVLNRG